MPSVLTGRWKCEDVRDRNEGADHPRITHSFNKPELSTYYASDPVLVSGTRPSPVLEDLTSHWAQGGGKWQEAIGTRVASLQSLGSKPFTELKGG